SGETEQGSPDKSSAASREESMNPYLGHLAQRVSDAPDFLACALAEYARSEKLADPDLAARLGCPVATLTHLRLCRMPRVPAPLFAQDIDLIAQRFAVDADVLAEMTRRGQSLWHMRQATSGADREGNFFLAARDNATEGAES